MKVGIVNAIVLSSGLSSRMGDFKPLLNYNGKPFFAEIICKLESICSSVLLVTGFSSGKLIEEFQRFPEFSKTKTVYNPDYESGMFSSLQTGLRNLPETDWAIIHMVDQPGLPPEFYNEFVNELDSRYDWIQPLYEGRKGHPIAISSGLFSTILSAPKESTLRNIFSGEVRRSYWDCRYSGVLTDIDTPEDYQKLLKHQE